MNIITKVKEMLINSFYPKHIKCICCHNELSYKNVYDTCDNCKTAAPFITQNFCERCGLQFDKDGTGICLNCKATNFNFTLARSVFKFDKNIAQIIYKLKYARYKFLAEPLAHYLHDKLKILNWKIDLISFVPLFSTREKQRGYNQARELASNLSNISNIPLFDDIIRLRETPTQTQLSRRERQENVKDCFKLTTRKGIANKNILIIDDVFTSGSTTNEVSKIFKSAGVKNVYVLTVAHAGFEQRF